MKFNFGLLKLEIAPYTINDLNRKLLASIIFIVIVGLLLLKYYKII